MAKNCGNFGFNQNALCTSGFLGFREGSNDLPVTPSPNVQLNNDSHNSFFMGNSPKNHGFSERYGDLTITQFHEGQNQPLIKGSPRTLGNDSRYDGTTFTFSQSGQNSAPFIPRPSEIRGGINRTGSSYGGFNNYGSTSNTSRNLSGLANEVNRSSSGRQCLKRVRFRFVQWSNEEENVMDQEILKCTSLPVKTISIKIANLLPRKSVRDVMMRIQWLIKHEKIDDIWGWVEPSPGEDLSELSFFLPDNPNDPDHLAVQNMLHPRATKRPRV